MLDISIGVRGGVLSKDTESDPSVALTSTLSDDVNILMRSNSSSRDRLSSVLLVSEVGFLFDFFPLRFVGSS